MRDAPLPRMQKLPPRVYSVMAMTTLGTFCALVASYQLLFPGPFA